MWWIHRITALSLLAATFVLGFLGYLGFGLYLLFVCVMTFILFLHIQLGVQCIVEDYVHTQESTDLALFLVRVGCIVQAKCVLLFFVDTESTSQVIGELVNRFLS
jgi:hypothetical protein